MVSEGNCGKFFKGKTIPFDIYVARKSNTPNFVTRITGTDGVEFNACIKESKFIPNFHCKDLDKVIAKDGEERIDFLHKSIYSTGTADVLDVPNKKTNEFKYPCVYSVSADEKLRGRNGGSVTLRYSREIKTDDSGNPIFFGVPKVIFGTWQRAGIPYIDHEGEYGLCQDVAGIPGGPADLKIIAKVLEGSRFRNMMEAVKFGTRLWNKHIMRMLRKDFWKEFVDKDGNLIDEDGNIIDRDGNRIDTHGNIISVEENGISGDA